MSNRLILFALIISHTGFIPVIAAPVDKPKPLTAAAAAEPGFRDSGMMFFARITNQPWAKELKGLSLADIRLAEPKKGMAMPTGLPAVWHANIMGPEGTAGYLMWDCQGKGDLMEFAIDANLDFDGPDAKVLKGVPPLQQFAMMAEDGSPMASGCVPTAAGSVAGFWVEHGQREWLGDTNGPAAEVLTKRIRARLKMTKLPDQDGFTEDGMALAGAFPHLLAAAIQKDADELKVPVVCSNRGFTMEAVKEEIAAGRPVLLSCTVRVPHKPELSWGHEVAGVGWAVIGETPLVGVIDNFYPCKHPNTIRWIRADAFRLLTTVRPQPPPEGKGE